MFKCNECSMVFKSKLSLSNHNRIHTKENSNLRNNIINDYVNNYLTYKELNIKYGLSYNTISKFVKGIYINKNEKRYKRKKIFKHSDETKKIISESRKKWLKDNPEKHVWKRTDKFKSIPCETLKKILKENGFDFLPEHTVISGSSYAVDIAFPNVKIGLEVNGNQHYNRDCSLKDYYLDRKNKIENEGWKLYDIHYSKVYDDLFIKSLIDSLNENDLKGVDLSFYIKKKKEKGISPKEKYLNKIKPIIEKIKQSDINFSKKGWVKEVSKIIGIHENVAGRWIRNNMPDFYNDKCKKRVVKYFKENIYYEKPKYCMKCGNVMIFDQRFQKFCSTSCASSYNNSFRKKSNVQ